MSELKSNIKLLKKIGGGFFGDVFLAKDEVHGDVAVKVVRQYTGESDAQWSLRKEAILREGQRLSQAQHENVVRVHYVSRDETTGVPWLIMELCERGLQEEFDAGPMRLTDVRRVTSQVCLGLESLHCRGMLHRDIKPGNILLGKGGTAKLGDFGLVTDNLILGYGSVAGYSDHLPPEVLSGSPTSAKSDIWALGMTIYRLLHGAEWYSRLPSDPQVLIPLGGFATSLPWLPHISTKWRRTIRKMMHDDPSQRCQTASNVLTALSAVDCEPHWDCTVTQPEIRWERAAGQRRIVVVWKTHSPRRHEWAAWSEPLSGKVKRYSLGGSGRIISRAEADRELREFFST